MENQKERLEEEEREKKTMGRIRENERERGTNLKK